MFKKLLLALFFILISSNLYAEDLIQILSKAFESNSKFDFLTSL